MHNKTKVKKKATYLKSKWVQGLSEKLAEKKLVGEERREEAFAEETQWKERMLLKEEKKCFLFF